MRTLTTNYLGEWKRDQMQRRQCSYIPKNCIETVLDASCCCLQKGFPVVHEISINFIIVRSSKGQGKETAGFTTIAYGPIKQSYTTSCSIYYSFMRCGSLGITSHTSSIHSVLACCVVNGVSHFQTLCLVFGQYGHL